MRKSVTQQQSGRRRDRAASPADALPGYREADGLYLPLTLSEEGFGYSDGDEAESYLDELIARTADRSLFSPALLNGIRDWPSRYHLSPKRANLLRPFAEHLRGDVLEVGAGCGAITRFLGENGGAIVAVEGSARRARIARARTAELKNVSVVCDRIEALRTTKRFDAITVIGVLEYARNFGEAGGVAAQAAMLSHLRGLLAQHGVVILAIENRLGLKYFAGAREDHEGMPFFGINDSYRMDGSATFGQAELGALLDQAGLGHQAWFVPCPDYKLPVTIVAPARARDQTELISTLLAQSVTVDPQGIADPTFSLEQAWSAICQNGLLEHLANSFLVIAGATPQAIARLSGAADMAWHYSVERHPAFVKQARFVRTGGDVTVIRRRLTDAATPDVPLACRLADETCIAGRNWWRELVLIGNRPGWTVADLAAWARVWCDALKKECRIKEMDASSLAAPVAGRHFDATPFNMVRRADGSVDFFDREWDVVPKLEFGFVMFRGLRDSLLRVTSYAEPANDTPVIANDLALAILVELGLLVTKVELERYAHMEAQIQNWVRGTRAVPGADEASAWSWRAALRIRLPAERDAQAQAVAQWQARLSEAVRQTHAARADAEALRTRTAGLAAEHDADRAEAERSLAALTQERDAARAREYEARMQVQSLAGELDLVRDHLAQKRSALATAQEQAAVQSEAHRAETNALRAKQDLLRHTVTRQAGAIAAAETKQARRPFAAATRALARRFARFRREPAGAPAWEVEAIRQSRLFSPRWYLTRHPDVAAAGADALTHYLTRGAREARDPHPLFDARWYARQYPKAREAAMSPLAHYATVGVPEGLDPHPLFDTDFYLRANPDVAATHGNPLFHYMAHGAYEGRDLHPLFDSSWYLERNPDVAAARDNPLVHYITHGWKEGRDPHPLFDVRWYLRKYPDVAEASQDPLVHYVRIGSSEGRSPHVLFDGDYYLHNNPDIDRESMTSLEHYLMYGASEGRNPHPHFDTTWYLKRNSDVSAAGTNPLVHFVQHGAKEKRDPSPSFNIRSYQQLYPEAGRGNPLTHFLERGSFSVNPATVIPAQRLPRPIAPSDGDWKRIAPRKSIHNALVDVIVPVYKGYDDTLACIHAVLRNDQNISFELVVIDDCSPDRSLTAKLKSLAERGIFTYLRNDENLGFVQTVNRGLALHPDRDAVLLNSDAVVYSNWLDRMIAHAASDPTIATITPFSNNATVCSYPNTNQINSCALEVPPEVLDRYAAACNAGGRNELPSGVGFCFYMRRKVIHEIGNLDHKTFGRGYGEENDFCMRALKAGYRNVLAHDIFVYHTGELSFSETAAAARVVAQMRLEEKHPDYNSRVQSYIEADPSRSARIRIDLHRLGNSFKVRPVVFISHTWGGGIERNVEDLAKMLAVEGMPTVMLRVGGADRRSLSIELAAGVDGLYLPNLRDIKFGHDDHFISELLSTLNPKILHVHSTVGLSRSAVRSLFQIIQESGFPYVYTWHDFAPLCHRTQFVRSNRAYCGEPPLSECTKCFEDDNEVAPDEMSPQERRAAFTRFLNGAARCIVPSQSARARAMAIVSEEAISVVPHADRSDSEWWIDRVPIFNRPLRVAIVGAIGPHKGSDVLYALLQDAERRRLPIEFFLIGHSDRSDLGLFSNFRTSGAYTTDASAVAELKRYAPHLCFFPSICPETYCYTLSLAFAAGVPPVVFDLGATAERVREAGWGRVLSRASSIDFSALNDEFLQISVSELWANRRRQPVREPYRFSSYYAVPGLQ